MRQEDKDTIIVMLILAVTVPMYVISYSQFNIAALLYCILHITLCLLLVIRVIRNSKK